MLLFFILFIVVIIILYYIWTNSIWNKNCCSNNNVHAHAYGEEGEGRDKREWRRLWLLTDGQSGQKSSDVDVLQCLRVAEQCPAQEQRYIGHLERVRPAESVGQVAGQQRTDGAQEKR